MLNDFNSYQQYNHQIHSSLKVSHLYTLHPYLVIMVLPITNDGAVQESKRGGQGI